MIFWCFIPCLFVLKVGSFEEESDITFGPFFWSYQEEPTGYENVTGFFRTFQVMYGIALFSLAACPILAIVGFSKKSRRKRLSIAIMGFTLYYAVFSCVYTAQFWLSYAKNTFIFVENTPLQGFVFDSKLFSFPYPLYVVWFITISLFCLGAVVWVHKFDDELPQKIPSQEEFSHE
ncbi:hypothetical protein RF11_06983 [Thelohanellus kitauei]|uniref:Uncharacterized protein n=1 Tax=Thelohanellus kitauei TaxID=669202 RepID=A0A0C2JMP9_THEKT|nr:hypothetical protein RF11_06983 [Thelohanellus kitauei]